MRAGFAAIDVEYRIPDAPLGLGLVGRAAWFSGGRTNDGRNETFDPLFPAGGYVNDAEQFRGSNLATVRAGLSMRPTKTLTLRLSWDEYHRASKHDGLYAIGGAEVRDENTRVAGASRVRRVGGYLGMAASWTATQTLDVAFLAGRFFPGPFVDTTAERRANNIDFVRLDARFRF